MANVSITFIDPTGGLSALPLLAATIQAAADLLDRHLVFAGTLDIEVVADTTGTFGATGSLAFAEDRGGIATWEAAYAAESRSGTDPDPARADVTIRIDPTAPFTRGLWWDPAIASSLAANPPDDLTDAFSVLLNAMLHGLGIGGYRNLDDGAPTTDYQTAWDALVRVDAGKATFEGAATRALLGRGAEVRLGGPQGVYHLGNGPDAAASAMPWIERSPLNGYHFFLGERYLLGRLELALLQDIGWALEPTTLSDVVDRWDDRATPLFLVGWGTGEVLAGGPLDDRIEGRGGDDAIAGGGGIDTAAYLLPRASYELTRTAPGFAVRALGGDEGRDTLADVERLRFADVALALDLDGHAGLAARLIGTLFGAARVRDPSYAAAALELLDAGTEPLALAQLGIDVRFPGGATNETLVRTLYGNLTGAEIGAADLAYYTGLLAAGGQSPASLTLLAAQSALAAAAVDLTGLAASGLEFAG